MPPMEYISAATASHVAGINALLKAHIYFSYPHTLEDTERMLSRAVQAWVVGDGSEVVGVSIAVRAGSGLVDWKVIALHPAFRGRGIGSRLAALTLEGLVGETVFVECWVHPLEYPGEVTSDMIMAKMGFSEVAESDAYWAAECNSSHYCKHRTDKCVCSGKVMARNLAHKQNTSEV